MGAALFGVGRALHWADRTVGPWHCHPLGGGWVRGSGQPQPSLPLAFRQGLKNEKETTGPTHEAKGGQDCGWEVGEGSGVNGDNCA